MKAKIAKTTKSKLIKTSFYADVKAILEDARNVAVKSVNFSMVVAYWKVGKRIVDEEQLGKTKAAYGEYIIKALSDRLSAEFGKGFTESNLRYMRAFYVAFPIRHALRDESISKAKKSIRHALRDESSIASSTGVFPVLRNELYWTHYRLIIKVENPEARNYYMNEAANENWSTRTLERQINTFYFERLLSSKNKRALVQSTNKEVQDDKPSVLDFVKDPYVLEFLQLNPSATLYERELETELLNKLQLFLLELGKGFSFVERQKRISAEGDHFNVDLVFYNYIIKCFVLFDLKVGKLSHQDIGQMDLYVRYFEDNIKQPNDNPTIGIILCSEKNDTIVKYSILKESKQLFASKYKLYLPTEKELITELKAELQQWKNKKSN